MVRHLMIGIQVVRYVMFPAAIKDKELCEIKKVLSI